jgi:hypothetical protein
MSDLKTSVQFFARLNMSFSGFHLNLLKASFLKCVKYIRLFLPDHAHVAKPHYIIQEVVEEATQTCEQGKDLHQEAVLGRPFV